jgi:hypothetical protein
MKYHISLPPS